MVGCLILHGYTGGPYEVAPLSVYLKEKTDWCIHVPTLPGHGRNLALENISYKKWISASEQALEKLKKNCDDIYIIGFSMGGMIAAYLAAKFHISKLVLLAPSGKYLSWKQLARDAGTFIADGIRRNLEKNMLYLNYKRKMGMIPFQANIEFLKLVYFTRKHLKNVHSEVLIVQGHQDGMVPYKTAYYLDKEMEQTEKEIVFLDRSKHLLCHGEDKHILNKMVHHFLMRKVSAVHNE